MKIVNEDGLTMSERVELDQLEAAVEKGRATFVEVGRALGKIRTGRLYRETHTSFDGYLLERWNFTRQHAAQLIGAAEVMGNLSTVVDSPLPDSERQTRPLASLPAEQQRQVWQVATEGGRKPTAAEVQDIVDRATAGRPVYMPSVERVTREDVEREEGRIRDAAQRDGRRDLVQAVETAVRTVERRIGRLDGGEQEDGYALLQPFKIWLAGL